MILTYLLVALGGSLGALTRYITNNLVSVEIPDKPYLSILIVNVIGSILLGFFYYVSHSLELKPNIREFFVVGYLGSLTTFSAFSFEFVHMLDERSFMKAITYLSLNLVLGFLSIYLFLRLIKDF